MGSRIEVSEECINKIRDLINEGLNLSEISRKLKFSRDVIRRVVRENDIKRDSRHKEPAISKGELYNLYCTKNYDLLKISKIYKCSRTHISQKLKEYGIPLRHGKYSAVSFDKEQLRKWYLEDNLTKKQISEKMNCSINTVAKYLKEYNIKDHKISRLEKIEKLFRSGITSLPELSQIVGIGKYEIKLKLIGLGLINDAPKKYIDKEELLKLVISGKSISDVAKKFQVSQSTINRELSKLGITRKTHALENITYDDLYDSLITRNLGISEVAKALFVSVSTLKNHMKQVGLNLSKERQKLRDNALSENSLRDLYFNKKMKQEEIAKFMGVSRSRISEKFKEYNIKKPEKWSSISIELLKELYVVQNLPPCLISEKLKVPNQVIRDKISRYNLKKYKTAEQIRGCRNIAYEKSLTTSRSKGEIEIESLFPTPYHNIHSVIDLEIDLWYPQKCIAIEYNGDYWHSTKFPRNSGLHIAKLAICKNKGIHLINIFERDWHNSHSKKLIALHLKRNLQQENLKKPEGILKKISNSKENSFSNKYNFNRSSLTQKCIGLYYDENLISAISYIVENGKCKISRYSTHENYIEDYTKFIKYLLEKYKMPVTVEYDNRYYNRFPCTLSPNKEVSIDPRLYYVKSRKALRKEDATAEYLEHPKCLAVYDCGYTVVTYY